jgi:hypothetical protein
MDELLQAARHESFISHGWGWGGTACKTAAASSTFSAIMSTLTNIGIDTDVLGGHVISRISAPDERSMMAGPHTLTINRAAS